MPWLTMCTLSEPTPAPMLIFVPEARAWPLFPDEGAMTFACGRCATVLIHSLYAGRAPPVNLRWPLCAAVNLAVAGA
jgi:hypothetical protein